MNVDLTAAVDVYYEWVDACEAVQNNSINGSVKATREPAPLKRRGVEADADEDELDDGFIEHDEPDLAGEYDDAD